MTSDEVKTAILSNYTNVIVHTDAPFETPYERRLKILAATMKVYPDGR